jgi:dTDP-4-amino-4,6-dideoxygalactose transaminase
VLDSGALFAGPRASAAGVLDVGSPLLVTRGAGAIRLILQKIGVQPGDEVLVPAFNCPSMVEPIEAESARPVFYGIAPDLRIGADHLEPHLSARTRAILAPHLFNRLQDLRAIRALCEAKRLVLIEDCAHALFGAVDGAPIGSVGHFAIASPRKFLPLEEGGLLTSASTDVSVLGKNLPPRERSLRLAFDAVDHSVSWGRLPGVRPPIAMLKALRRWSQSTAGAPALPDLATATELTGAGLGRSPPHRASAVTRWLISRLATQDMVRRRRENYQLLADALADCATLSVLNADIQESFVPYMLPVALEDPEHQFATLKAMGMPMWRWEHSRMGVCAVTDKLARALIQIPCHQSLRASELEWIIDGLRKAGGAGK